MEKETPQDFLLHVAANLLSQHSLQVPHLPCLHPCPHRYGNLRNLVGVIGRESEPDIHTYCRSRDYHVTQHNTFYTHLDCFRCYCLQLISLPPDNTDLQTILDSDVQK